MLRYDQVKGIVESRSASRRATFHRDEHGFIFRLRPAAPQPAWCVVAVGDGVHLFPVNSEFQVDSFVWDVGVHSLKDKYVLLHHMHVWYNDTFARRLQRDLPVGVATDDRVAWRLARNHDEQA
tara:strand:- start:180 stop:548 length:369 start_codon:yes stop_codon:yes gene_type:complete